jgi:hypothetical protein
MDDLTTEQVQQLAVIVIETFGSNLTGDELTDRIAGVLEDIPGFDLTSEQTVSEVIDEIRNHYGAMTMSDETDNTTEMLAAENNTSDNNNATESEPVETPSKTPSKAAAPKAKSAPSVKKAVALGKEMRKDTEVSKADIARKMYETISSEPRDVIIQAFVDGAGLTPKGAQTYYYNCKRKAAKAAAQ